MKEKLNYRTERDLFDSVFKEHKNKRIVLYGIGRLSASLIPSLKDYNFVGLMDRDTENIGKEIYGLPVLSKEEAEKIADLIIINTRASYWETIYQRIKDIKIPIYFNNGEKGSIEDSEKAYNTIDYWNKSYEELKDTIKQYDIISFDIFDTLISRKVYLPQDIFEIVNRRIKSSLEINFTELRNKACAILRGQNVLLDDIYEVIQQFSDLSEDEIRYIKELELSVEYNVTVPRADMIKLYREAVELKKRIFLLSDMYLPKAFIIKLLKKIGVEINEDNIWISGEKKISKAEGTMWCLFKEKIVKGDKALHIGDDYINDITNSRKYGIDGYYIMSPSEILRNSSIGSIVPDICTHYDSCTMGLIIAKLFNSPFCLNRNKGKVYFNNFNLLGYCIFGTVILSFLFWLIIQSREDNIKRLFFFSRDGYFLVQDYEHLVSKLDGENFPDGNYLAISRRLISVVSIKNEDDFYEVAQMPYSGSFGEYMKDRFDISVPDNCENKDTIINASSDIEKISDWLKPYAEQLRHNITKEKENYLKYLDKIGLEDKFAVIDLWYYGNAQYYLSKLLGKGLIGYYFVANMTDDNRCRANNVLIPCFQEALDSKADRSNIFKHLVVVESVLTAPYGMIIKVNDDSSYFCDKDGQNQKHFTEKIDINEGVKDFIDDFVQTNDLSDIDRIIANPFFSDKLFGVFWDNNCDLSETLKNSFFSDNGLFQKRQFKIFE